MYYIWVYGTIKCMSVRIQVCLFLRDQWGCTLRIPWRTITTLLWIRPIMCQVNESRGATSQEECILACECVCSTWLWLFSRPYGSCWVSTCLSCSLWPDGPQRCSMVRISPLQHTAGARVQNKTHTYTVSRVLEFHIQYMLLGGFLFHSATILCAHNHIYMYSWDVVS